MHVHPSHGHRDYRHPPQRKSMHAHIVRDLGMRIVGGKFKPGDRLPAEATLLADYDVSRPVLREATRVLVAKGLVLSRQRAGAIVRPRNEWHLLDPDVLYWFIHSQPQHEFVETLLTVRRVFEPAAAALAAKVASDSALQGIAEAYRGMEAARTANELLEPDLAFHHRIAEATNNDLLAYIGNMLSLALRESIKLSSRLPNTHALSLPRHKAILTALLNRDPLAAQQATFVQLEETHEDLSRILDSTLRKAS
jgi:DNA-binding FadR family transcriptional regulator